MWRCVTGGLLALCSVIEFVNTASYDGSASRSSLVPQAHMQINTVLAPTHSQEYRVPDPVLTARGGYPRGIHSRDGTTVYLCTGGKGLQVSSAQWNDGIRAWSSWSLVGTVIIDDQEGVDLANCVLHELENGTLLAAYRHHTGCSSEATLCARYALEASVSSDKGISWKPLSTIVAGSIGMWEPFFFETLPQSMTTMSHSEPQDARTNSMNLWVAYSQELTNGGLQSIVWQRTEDRGVSWQAPVTISDGSEHNSRDGMPGLAYLPDGSIILVFEGFWAYGKGHFSVQARRSYDQGVTWSNGRVIYATPNSTRNAGAPQVACSGDTVVVSFMTDEDVSQHDKNAIRWPADAATKVILADISKNADITPLNGRKLRPLQFHSPTTIHPGPYALWPGLLTVNSGGLVATSGMPRRHHSRIGNVSHVFALYGFNGDSYVVGPLTNTNTTELQAAGHPS